MTRDQLIQQAVSFVDEAISLGNFDPIVGLVFATTDYTKHTRITGNRKALPSSLRIRVVATSMAKVGQQVPGVVLRSGELEDGQGRRASAQMLSLPFVYVYAPVPKETSSDQQIILLMEAQKTQRWTAGDCIAAGVERGNSHYKWMSDIMKKYGIQIGALHTLCTGRNLSQSEMSALRELKLTHSEDEQRVFLRRLHIWADLACYLKTEKQLRTFFAQKTIEGLLPVIEHKKLNMTRMREVMVRWGQEDCVPGTNDINRNTRLALEAYNYHLGEENRIRVAMEG